MNFFKSRTEEKETHFIWPKGSFRHVLTGFLKLSTSKEIEDKLQEMFPTGYPVLCSSGRVAIALALTQSKVNRSDFVEVFPFASHCVLDSVSRAATPIAPGDGFNIASIKIIHHQWGYVQEVDLPPNSIEDCVDTLCVKGAKLFPGGGAYEIWSLPKIIGSTSGGILWCRTKELADGIKILRETRGVKFTWILRLLGRISHDVHLCWAGIEPSVGGVSILQAGEISTLLEKWDEIVLNRVKNLEKIWPHAVSWLKKPVERLPSVVPINFDLSALDLARLGVLSGYRMIQRTNPGKSWDMRKVVPIPIHQDVSINWLTSIIKYIEK